MLQKGFQTPLNLPALTIDDEALARPVERASLAPACMNYLKGHTISDKTERLQT